MIIGYEVWYKTPRNEWRQFGKRHTMYRDAKAEFDSIKERGILKAARILEIEESDEIINEWSRDDEKD